MANENAIASPLEKTAKFLENVNGLVGRIQHVTFVTVANMTELEAKTILQTIALRNTVVAVSGVAITDTYDSDGVLTDSAGITKKLEVLIQGDGLYDTPELAIAAGYKDVDATIAKGVVDGSPYGGVAGVTAAVVATFEATNPRVHSRVTNTR